VNAALRRAFPAEITVDTIVEDFRTDDGRVGTVNFHVYLMADVCGPAVP
jgi:hypothetical protein